MAEAFTTVIPLPAGTTEDEMHDEAYELFEEALTDRGLILASDVVSAFLPQQPIARWPKGAVETNGPDLPRPVTADGPAWQFTAYVDTV